MSLLAFDLGASSGRAVLGRFDGEKLTTEIVHRFSNDPVQVGDHLHWDILRIFYEIKQGILQSQLRAKGSLQSMAIDSWAVDFGLLDKDGQLLGNPYHYRDHQTDGMMEEVFSQIPKAEIFSRTGIQFMPINTLYHLYAMQKRESSLLANAHDFLMIPDLLRYFLTGEKKSEFTNATTTQFFHTKTKQWDRSLLQSLQLPDHLFGEVVQPGTVVGQLRPEVRKEVNVIDMPVIAVGEHDTASAVVAVPAEQKDFAYLSCGTWSLLGTEVGQPVISEQALKWNFTNEGGVEGTYRLLKNIMGLWLVQSCQRSWRKSGLEFTYDEMMEQVDQVAPFSMLIDPDDSMFLNPTDMPTKIQAYCKQTGQHVPQSVGEILRCIMESLALKYRFILERTEQLSGKTFPALHMVGGGINNTRLCQFTANAIGRPVYAGPAEGTSIGNLLVQMIAVGQLKNIQEARQLVKHSFAVRTYEPTNERQWNDAYGRFSRLISNAS